MRCAFPRESRRGGRSYPCGQCHSCQAFQRSELVGQVRAEAALYGNDLCAFTTATIKDEYYPRPGDRDALRALVRYALRDYPWPRRLLVIERGDRGGRLHFHVLTFCCSPLEVDEYWRKRWQGEWIRNMPSKIGKVDTKPFVEGTAGYLARYVSKGQIARQVDFYRRDGFGVLRPVYPRPGLGFGVVPKIKPTLESVSGRLHLVTFHDVPDSLRFNGIERRMPRAIRRRLREAAGVPSSSKDREKVREYLERCIELDPTASRVRARRDAAAAAQLQRDASKLHESRRHLDPGYREAYERLQAAIADGSFDAQLEKDRAYRSQIWFISRLGRGKTG